MAIRRPQQLGDLTRLKAHLKLTCRGCGHSGAYAACDMVSYFSRRGWNQSWEMIGARFRCDSCGSKAVEVGMTAAELPPPAPPPPVLPPVTVAYVMAEGIRSIDVSCECGHSETISASSFSPGTAVPSIRFRLRCSACGKRPYDTRPAWHEVPKL